MTIDKSLIIDEMGAELTKFTLPHIWNPDEPDCEGPIKYDPHYGFKEERKKKGKLI